MSIMARGSKMKKAWIFFLMAAFVSGFSIASNEQPPEEQQATPPNPIPLLNPLTAGPSW